MRLEGEVWLVGLVVDGRGCTVQGVQGGVLHDAGHPWVCRVCLSGRSAHVQDAILAVDWESLDLASGVHEQDMRRLAAKVRWPIGLNTTCACVAQ